jgi:hypothetical protein
MQYVTVLIDEADFTQILIEIINRQAGITIVTASLQQHDGSTIHEQYICKYSAIALAYIEPELYR